jgi:hypothetical protein
VDGAAYLVGDAADLQRWDNALLSGRLLQGRLREVFFDGSPTGVGLENSSHYGTAYYCYGGLAKFNIQGHVVVGANGGTLGFSTYTGMIPDNKVSVTMLNNLGDADNAKIIVPIGKCQASCRSQFVTTVVSQMVPRGWLPLLRWPGPPTGVECAMALTAGKVRCSPSLPCSRGTARCAWLRVAPLLSSPSLRAMAWALPGRDGKAGSPVEPESSVRVIAA